MKQHAPHFPKARYVCGRLALGLALAVTGSSVLVGCVAQTTDIDSTDTGNPPAIDESTLHVEQSEPGKVVVYADPGGISPGGAVVKVTNTATNDSASTTIKNDGSFEVMLDGAVTDEFKVAVEADGETKSITISADDPVTPNGLEALIDHEYLLDSATGFTLVEGTNLSIRFEQESFSFHAGCNGHDGQYTFCGQNLCIESMGSTEIGCDEPRHMQDVWLDDFFTSTPALSLDGSTLTVEGTEATLVFVDREVANPDRMLVGNTWTVDTFFENGSAGSLPISAAPTLSFGEDGTVQVFSGCNSGGGTFEVEGNTITLSAFGYTEEGCNDEGAQSAEQHVQAVMQEGSVTFEIEAARLTLMREDEDIGLGATTE